MREPGYGRTPGRRDKVGTDAPSSRTVRPSSKPRTAGDQEAALAAAIQFVTSRPRTAYEVRQKLARSGVTDAVAESVMAHIHERGLLDDAVYTRAYLTSRLSHRGYGPQRISRELHQRGVERTVIEDAVQHNLDTDDVLDAARVQATKRWSRLTRDADPARRRQKLYDFLRRRGFASAIVQQVLTELLDETQHDGRDS
jgi:regulatory protein